MTGILSPLLYFRGRCREEEHAVWLSLDAAARPDLLRPPPGGIHQRLQPQSPDASVELLHHRQASKCVNGEESLNFLLFFKSESYKNKWIHFVKKLNVQNWSVLQNLVIW